MELYSRISGRKSYSPYQDEVTPGDLSSYITTPFPYSTYSHNTVSEQLIAVGNLIQVMGLKPAGSILEFGPGWGLSTLELVQMGYRVTAVDVCEMFVELIRERTRRLEQKVSLACSDMLEYRPDQQFDRVLFYECFHHCSDHQRMIRNLDQMVSPGGAVVFAGEPILDDFHAPWGVRLDGMSAWSIRKFGWLELGFRTDYFRRLLRPARLEPGIVSIQRFTLVQSVSLSPPARFVETSVRNSSAIDSRAGFGYFFYPSR